MLSRPPDQPFPFEEVRDLLGIVRALYRARREAGAPELQLRQIVMVGTHLAEAIALATEYKPFTVGRSAAWKKAEQATLDAADLIKSTDGAQEIVEAARAAVKPPY
jgi:hypothetical protein